MKKAIIIAAMMLAAVAPMRAQDFQKVNDSTWVRYGVNEMGVYDETAAPINVNMMVAEINNDLIRCAHLRSAALGCGAVSMLSAAWAVNRAKHSKPIVFQEVVCGVMVVGAVALEVAEIVTLNRKKVYITPEGVAIRITHSNKKKIIEYTK